jgi:hypothetical protein
VRTLLEFPVTLEGSAENIAVNGTTELGVPPGKICVTVVPKDGVVLPKGAGLLVWSRSSSSES